MMVSAAWSLNFYFNFLHLSRISEQLHFEIFAIRFFDFICYKNIFITNMHGLHAGFVVHRGRTIPTLASMQEPLPAARSKQSKERMSIDLKAEERGKCQHTL